MAKSMSQVRAVYSELGYMSAAYGETFYSMNKQQDASKDVAVCSKFEVMFVNRYITITDYDYDLFATSESLYFKDKNKLNEIVNMIKGIDYNLCRCDNIDAFRFSAELVSKSKFKYGMSSNGFSEEAIDFEFWVLLTGGIIEDVRYKTVNTKCVYPKFWTNIFGNANFEEIHFPIIAPMSKSKFEEFYSISVEVFKEFGTLFFKRKFIKCERKSITTFDDFRSAVDFNMGEEVDTSVVARFLFYRHELTHSLVMKSINKSATTTDVAFGIHFPSAPAVIRKMTPDTLFVDEARKKITVHETFVTDSGNVMKLASKKRSKYSLTSSYFVGYEIEIFVNGLCISNPAQSVMESNLTTMFPILSRKSSPWRGL